MQPALAAVASRCLRRQGQGLAIAHSIVTEKYGGQLFFFTEVGVGTSFHIQIPLGG